LNAFKIIAQIYEIYFKETNYLFKIYKDFLKKHFLKENTFFSDGYFVCSIGEASPDTIREYILNQG